LNNDERMELHVFIAHNPLKGDVISGTGGARKMRWSYGNKGKRGGSRIIYFYHIIGSTIYLLSCYAKNEQTDLNSADKKHLKVIIDQITNGEI
jgi:hypothetical protein